MKVSDLGEDRVIDLLARGLRQDKHTILGPGDDCAVVKVGKHRQLLKTDSIVEGVHFLPSDDPRAIGRKALCRAISDIAAMGGFPRHALVSLAAPVTTGISWLERLYEGINGAARKYGVNVVGGETSRSPGPVFISVFLTGSLAHKDRFVSRSGGKPGDHLFVTGRLGGSLNGRHLAFTPRVAEANWLVKEFSIHAMMDLSDGLAADLPRMSAASGLGFHLENAKIPLNRGCSLKQALQDGEDYELLFSVSPRSSKRLARMWPKKFPWLPLTHIGEFRKGKASRIASGGWDHFKS